MQWRKKQRVLYVIGSAHHALLIKQYRDDGECMCSPNDDEGDGISPTPLDARPTNPHRGGKPRNSLQRGSNEYKQPALTTEKKTFNEEEYTKITTPRQDVLFKKGYLGRKKPTTPEANVGPIAKTGGAADSDRADVQTDDSPQYVYSGGYVDQGGVYYINGGSYELYDPYTGNVTVVVGPAPHYAGAGGGPPVLAAVSCQPLPLQPLEWFNPAYFPYTTISCPRDRRKRSSTDSQNCSPQSSESTEPPGSPQDGAETVEDCNVYQPQAYVYPGYMFGPPLYSMNGITIQGAPLQAQSIEVSGSKRRKKKRRRRRRRGGVDDGFEGSSSDDKDLEEAISFTSQDSSQDLESDSKHSAESTSCHAKNSKQGVQEEMLKSDLSVSKENTSSLETNNDNLEIEVVCPEQIGFTNGIYNNHISNISEVRQSTREIAVMFSCNSHVNSETKVDCLTFENVERESGDKREERDAGDLSERYPNGNIETNLVDDILIVKANRSSSNIQLPHLICSNEEVDTLPSLGSENTVVLFNTQHKENISQTLNTKERNKSKRHLKTNHRTHEHMNGCHELQQNMGGCETPIVLRSVSETHNSESQYSLSSKSKTNFENQCNSSQFEECSFNSNPADESSNFVSELSRKFVSSTEPPAREGQHLRNSPQLELMEEGGNVEDSNVSCLLSLVPPCSQSYVLPTAPQFTHLPSVENNEKLLKGEIYNIKTSSSEKQINASLEFLKKHDDMQNTCLSDTSEHEVSNKDGKTIRNPTISGTSQRPELDVKKILCDTECKHSIVLSSIPAVGEVPQRNSSIPIKSEVATEIGTIYGCGSAIESTDLELQDLDRGFLMNNPNKTENAIPPIPPPRRKKWQHSRKPIGHAPRSNWSNEFPLDENSTSSASISRESEESVIELLSFTPAIDCNEIRITQQPLLEDEGGVTIETPDALHTVTKSLLQKSDCSIFVKCKLEPVNEVNKSKENKLSAMGKILLGKETFLSESKEPYADVEHRFVSNDNVSLRERGEQLCISNHSQEDITRDQSYTHSLINELVERQDYDVPLFVAERFADVIARRVINDALSISVAVKHLPFLPITEAVTKWLHSQSTEVVLSVPESEHSETDSTEEMEEEDNSESVAKYGNTTGSKNVLRNPLPASSRNDEFSMVDTGIRVALLDKKYISFVNDSQCMEEHLIKCCSKVYDINSNRFLIPENKHLKTRKRDIHQACQYMSANVCNSICSYTYFSDSTFNNDNIKIEIEIAYLDNHKKNEKCGQNLLSCKNRFENDTCTNTPNDFDIIITEEHMEYDGEWESGLITIKSTSGLTSTIGNEESDCSLNAESPTNRCFQMCDPTHSVSKYYRLGSLTENIYSPDQEISSHTDLGPPTKNIYSLDQEISSHTDSEEEQDTLEHFKDEFRNRDHYSYATSLWDGLYICEKPMPKCWSVDHIQIAQNAEVMHTMIKDEIKSGNSGMQPNESEINQNRKTRRNSTNRSTEKTDFFSRKSALLMSHFTNDGPFPCDGICCILQ